MEWLSYAMAVYHSFDPKDKRLEVICSEYVGTDGVTYNETNPGSIWIKGLLPIKYGEDPTQTSENSEVDVVCLPLCRCIDSDG